MHTGTMIEELIGSVERAEAHAADTSDNTLQLDAPPSYRQELTYDHEELLGVA